MLLLFVSESGSGPARIVSLTPQDSGAVTQVRLEASAPLIDPYGLARPGDGSIRVLADKGRSVARFDERSGKLLGVDALPEPCAGIWSVGANVIVAPVRLRGGEPLLALATRNGGFRPFTSLESRRGKNSAETVSLNMFECGFALAGALPCWWLNGEPEVLLIDEKEQVVRVPGASLVGPAGPPSGAARDFDAFLQELRFPMRDVFLLSRQASWSLTNQEGSRPLTDPARIRGRHLVLMEGGRVTKSIPLPKSGRAILGGDSRGVLVLYEDGSIDWSAVQ